MGLRRGDITTPDVRNQKVNDNQEKGFVSPEKKKENKKVVERSMLPVRFGEKVSFWQKGKGKGQDKRKKSKSPS